MGVVDLDSPKFDEGRGGVNFGKNITRHNKKGETKERRVEGSSSTERTARASVVLVCGSGLRVRIRVLQ